MTHHFDINVSLNGRHFFGVAERSTRDADHAYRLYRKFREAFPERDGYKVQMSRVVCYHDPVEKD